MVINMREKIEKRKKVKELELFLEETKDILMEAPDKEPISDYVFSLINKEMKKIAIMNKKKRKIAQELRKELNLKRIKIRYIECVRVAEFFLIGNKKINNFKFNSYLTLKENGKRVEK
jgi:hypothetical protein